MKPERDRLTNDHRPRFTEADDQLIRAIAACQGLTCSAVIRMFVRAGLERMGKHPNATGLQNEGTKIESWLHN